MRITGGRARGLIIKAPKGMRTRPTSDKVREALFDTLGAAVQGKNVLDLFAGTGALAIEALSRGAKHAALVEHDTAAARLIEDNLERAGFSEKAQIFRGDFRSVVGKLEKEGGRFDMVFIDPPYEGGFIEQITLVFAEHRIVLQDAVIVFEHFKKTVPPASISEIPLFRTRHYGQTSLSYYQFFS